MIEIEVKYSENITLNTIASWIPVYKNICKQSVKFHPEFHNKIFMPMIYHLILFGYINAESVVNQILKTPKNQVKIRQVVNQWEIDIKTLIGYFD